MLEDKIKKIQDTIDNDHNLSDEEREQLRSLLDELHAELEGLEKTHKKSAHHIAEQTHKTVEHGSKESAHSLKDSVQEFEVSHPNLTRIIQSLCAQFGV